MRPSVGTLRRLLLPMLRADALAPKGGCASHRDISHDGNLRETCRGREFVSAQDRGAFLKRCKAPRLLRSGPSTRGALPPIKSSLAYRNVPLRTLAEPPEVETALKRVL